MTAIEQKIQCPLIKTPTVPVCDINQLDSLCDYIIDNNPWTEAKTFERGSLCGPGRLDLCKQGIGVAGTNKLINALKGNDHIKHLLLGTDSLGDQGASTLAQYLAENAPIETVYLGCNVITHHGVTELAQSLEHNNTVKSLWLKRNPVGNEGIKAIAKMLQINTHLRTLDLVNTGVNHEGIAHIADALRNASAPVQAIYLGGNQLDEKSIESLISILTTPSLKALFLNVNNLGDGLIRALAENAHRLRSRLILGLASNSLSKAGLETLFEAQQNLQFEHLDLGYARSTQALGGSANFFGDGYGEQWNSWLKQQPNLHSLYLNKTGVGHKTLCKIIDTVRSHPRLHSLNLSKTKDPKLRQELRQSLDSKANLNTSNQQDDYLNDVAQIKSVYR